MGKKSHKSIHMIQKNTPSSCMDLVYFSIVYAFGKANGFDDTFTEIGLPSYWRILSPYVDDRICDKYGDYAIPIYECAFLPWTFVFSSLPLR